ncbi:MAG: exo-alpha-sialidase [Ruminococcaceae bacterium]|nr:exo-alpha-sialidase [Oscillospiraceae bacterium]
MKKILCSLLICSILLGNILFFTSCNQNEIVNPNSETITSEVTTPEETTPEETTPEVTTPEETTPEETTPEVTTPEETTPEETTPEVTTPEETTPEETTPEETTPEVTTPEETTPEVTTPEETTPEETTPEETTPEVTTLEETTPEEHEHIKGDGYACSICGESLLTPVEEAIEIGMSYEKGKYSSEYYYVELTLDNQVNPDGFARAKIAEGLYVSVAGGYLSGNTYGSIQQGNTVVFKAKLGAVNSSLTTGGKELRLFEVAAFEITTEHEHIIGDKYVCATCGKSLLIPVEEAIEIGMSYEKGKYSSEYYYVKLTLDNQVNPDGFARARIAEGLYVSVAGNYLSGNAQGSIHLDDTVVFKAKLGAVNSSLTTGGKELRLFAVADYEIVESEVTMLVEKEIIVPASGTGVAEKRLQYYLDAEGIIRKEIKEFQSQDDTADYREYRFSYDNGKTWTEWVREPLPAREPVGNDEIDENLGYQNAQHIYNPVVGHFVSLQCQFIYIDGYAATEALYWAGYTRPMHSFLMIEDADSTAHERVLVKYEEGADYDRATYRTTDYLTTNISRGSDLIVLANGDILFNLCIPVNVACEIAGLDLQEVFPTTGGLGHAWALLVARGVWNAETQQYDITYSKPVIMHDTLSTRGLSEPMFAELPDGRILCIFRTSTDKVSGWTYRLDPNAPACKYYVISEDGGKTFSEPKPWCYEDGEIVYSPASICQVVKSEVNGKLYWIGNACSKEEINGAFPRFPLYMIEIDQETGLAIRNSTVLIDTHRTGESDKVQLSNFCILENKENGTLEIYLSKLGQFVGKPTYECETWKYTVYLPKEVE